MAKKKAKKKAAAVAAKTDGVIALKKLTKEQALAELKEQGKELEFDRVFTEDDSLEVLRKAVSEGRKALAETAPAVGAEVETPEGDEPEEEVEEEEEEGDEVSGDSVDIVKGEGVNTRYIRTFCKSEHGKDFAKLAKEFCDKHNGKLDKKAAKHRIMPSAKIGSLTVRWEEEDKKQEGKVVEKTKVVKGASFGVKLEALSLANERGGQCLVR